MVVALLKGGQPSSLGFVAEELAAVAAVRRGSWPVGGFDSGQLSQLGVPDVGVCGRGSQANLLREPVSCNDWNKDRESG